MPGRAVPAAEGELQVVHLHSIRSCLQCCFEILPPRRAHPFHQAMSKELLFAVSHLETPRIRVTDQSGSIEHENHALRVIQDFLVEIALALKLCLVGSLFGDVEHQSPVLNHRTLLIADGENILHGVQNRAEFYPERIIVITKNESLRDGVQKAL